MVGGLTFKPVSEGRNRRERNAKPAEATAKFLPLPKRDLTMFMYKLRRKTFYYYQSARKRGGC